MFWESCIWNKPRGFSWVSNSASWEWREVGAPMEYWKGFWLCFLKLFCEISSPKATPFQTWTRFWFGLNSSIKKNHVSKTFYGSNRTIISGISPIMWALKYSSLCLTPDEIASLYDSWHIIPPDYKFVNSLYVGIWHSMRLLPCPWMVPVIWLLL